eukprot:jgi/Psemu1/3015/gm1.3015_g
MKNVGSEISFGDDENDKTPAIELAPYTQIKHPARVSLEPRDINTNDDTTTSTNSNIVRNPYAKQYNRNKRSERKAPLNQIKTAKAACYIRTEKEVVEAIVAPPPPTTTTTATKEEPDRIKNCAKPLLTNLNHFNTFGDKDYAKKVIRNHARFIQIVADATDPAKNNPGDEVLYEMFTKKEVMNDGLTLLDYLFYKTVSGKPNKQSNTIMDQALKIWTTHVTNLKTGKPLDFETHQVYIHQLFSAFHLQGVPYNPSDFKHRGGFIAAVNKDWKDTKIEDPTLGTKRNKAEFNEFVDEKFKKVIDDGTYKPYEDMLDLLKLMSMELGRQFRICGKKELVFLKWDYLKLGTFSHEAMKDLKNIIINPVRGFCKTNGLNINNAVVNVLYPMVVEDPENPKTTNIYFKPKSPVGADTIWKWVRDFAQVADFKDWENNNKPPIAPSTSIKSSSTQINMTKRTSQSHKIQSRQLFWEPRNHPSKDTLKKEVQKRKKDSKELKKENKKQRTKLQDAEDNVAQLTMDLKASNNINKTLSNEVNRLHRIGNQIHRQMNQNQCAII